MEKQNKKNIKADKVIRKVFIRSTKYAENIAMQ
jgi:hypothetical protein